MGAAQSSRCEQMHTGFSGKSLRAACEAMRRYDRAECGRVKRFGRIRFLNRSRPCRPCVSLALKDGPGTVHRRDDIGALIARLT
jgi:hypothetical protein